ncbi:MAG: Gx transporter family protein [Bacilli bacterium]|nr:Gx transporter family protein [Bacilli bacterium]
MNIKNQKTKEIVLIAVLVALAVILSYVDKIISQAAFPFLPTAKVGLANIVIIFSLYKLDFKKTFLLVIMKSLLAGLVLGNPVTFIISFFATTISFLGMFFARRVFKDKTSAVGISVIGGVLHIVIQLVVVSLIYSLGEVVISYGGILLLVSLVTSIIIGLISNKIIDYLTIK